ncbi:MAG: hypothetical protein Q9159_004085 [Coniocarpon cinnabarinum]
MDDTGSGIAAHLLRWINTFDFARSVTSYRDLQDGRILWKVLSENDPDYFHGELPEPNASTADNWIQRWQNRKSRATRAIIADRRLGTRAKHNLLAAVKQIEKLVTTFIRDEREKLPEVTKRMTPDLKAAAIDGSSEDSVQVSESFRGMRSQLAHATYQLLKLIFLAAIYSPHSNQRTVQKLSALGPAASTEIAQWIQNLELQDQRLVDTASQGPSSDAGMLSPNRGGASPEPEMPRDRDLMWEEQLISAKSTINAQREKIENLNQILSQRKKEHMAAEEELNELRARTEQGGTSTTSDEVVEQLRKKTAEDRDYIEEIESENHSLRERNEDMESKVARYKTDADQKTKLRDELQMIKVERDDYAQKAKAAENLRKKIQTLQESDKSNATLREDLESAQEELRGLQRLKDKNAAMQRTIEENQKTIANGEQEIFDIKTTRRRIDQDMKYYQQRHEASKDRMARDAEAIAELEEKIRDLESGRDSSTTNIDTLDDDISSTDKTHSELRARLAELEKENKQLKQSVREKAVPDTDGDITTGESVSKHALELLQQRYLSVERQYLDTYQENLGLDAALKSADPSVVESRPFIEIRNRLHDTARKLDQSERHVFEIEGELAEKQLALETADGRLASLGTNETAAAAEVRKSVSAEGELLRKEIERLSTRAQSLQIQLDERNSLLRHALSDQGRLLKDDEELRAANETRFVQDLLTQHKTRDDPSEEELVLSLAQRIEIGRKKVKEVEDMAKQVSDRHCLLPPSHPQEKKPSSLRSKQHKTSSSNSLAPFTIAQSVKKPETNNGANHRGASSCGSTQNFVSSGFGPQKSPSKPSVLQAFAASLLSVGAGGTSHASKGASKAKGRKSKEKDSGLRPLITSNPSNMRILGIVPNGRPPSSTPKRPTASTKRQTASVDPGPRHSHAWWLHADSPSCVADAAPQAAPVETRDPLAPTVPVMPKPLPAAHTAFPPRDDSLRIGVVPSGKPVVHHAQTLAALHGCVYSPSVYSDRGS